MFLFFLPYSGFISLTLNILEQILFIVFIIKFQYIKTGRYFAYYEQQVSACVTMLIISHYIIMASALFPCSFPAGQRPARVIHFLKFQYLP